MELGRGATIVLLGTIALAGFAVGGSGLVSGGSATADAAPENPNETGIEFREASAETGFEYNTTEPSGVISDAGVYAADYDDDGWTDLLAIGAERPVLFENDGGEFEASGQLTDVNESIRSAVFLDYDADGNEDLVLFPRGGVPVVFHNDGGRLERTSGVLTANLTNPVGASAGDYDRDGCPDLFVIQNGDWNRMLPAGHETASVPPAEDNGHRNLLFHGTCGSFSNATEAAGIRGTTWSLATSVVDLDRDGWPDVHVANDFNNDVIYWNDGDGTFTREVLPNETNRNAMSSEVEDFSGDGRLDVFVTNIHLPSNVDGDVAFVAGGRAHGNNLLVNEGERQFETAGERCGVRRGGWGWAAVGADLDNDGDADLFHTTLEFTGHLGTELLKARQTSPAYSYPVLFESRSGTDCRFVRRNASAAGFEVTDGHGVAQTDFDRDGDVDVAMAVSGGPNGGATYRLYENVGTEGNALQVRIVGQQPTGDTRVHVETAEGTQMRVHHSRTDYFSQDERVLHFGVANHSSADIRVVWPDGSERTFEDLEAGNRFWISRDGVERTIALDGPPAPSVVERLSSVAPFAIPIVVTFAVAAVGYRRYRNDGGRS